MECQGHEQLVEFNSMDRNHDGMISAAELDTYRRMNMNKSGQGGCVANSSLAGLPSIEEGHLAPSPTLESMAARTDEILPPAGPTPLLDGSTLDLAPVGSYQLAFGLPVRDTFESTPVRVQKIDKTTELVHSHVAESASASVVLKLDPGLPYLISVHTAKPATLTDYTLFAYSDAIMSLTPIETTQQRVLRGAWKSQCSGGSHIEEPTTWTHNPQYALTLSSATTVQLVLERPANKWARLQKLNTLEAMMGFYVLRGDGRAPHRNPTTALPSVVHQATFMPSMEAKCTLYLEPLPDGSPYIVMPATFGAGMRGPFSIGINTDQPCTFESLTDPGSPRGRG